MAVRLRGNTQLNDVAGREGESMGAWYGSAWENIVNLMLRSPRTWVVIALSVLLVVALLSPLRGTGPSVTEAAPQAANGPVETNQPSSGMGDRTGVQDVVTYTVRDSSGRVIEQGTTGTE